MSKVHIIAYAIISGITPLLVLFNSLQGTEAFSSSSAVQPLQSISWLGQLAPFEPENFSTTQISTLETAVEQPQAHIVTQRDHLL